MAFREDEIVDVSFVNEVLGIKIKNPIFNRHIVGSMRDKLLVSLYLLWKKRKERNRKKLYKGDEIKDNLSIRYITEKHDNSVGGEQDISESTSINKEPFFNVEYIVISEYYPREYVDDLSHYLTVFKRRYEHCQGYTSIHTGESLDDYTQFKQKYFEKRLLAICLDEECELGKFFSTCEINMSSASLSFVRLDFKLTLNDYWKKRLNTIAISNMKPNPRLFYIHQTKLRDYYKIADGYLSGSLSKCYVINALFEEMKYKTRKVLYSSFKFPTYKLTKNMNNAFILIATNIDSNEGKEFWRSVGIDCYKCFLNSEYDTCVTDSYDNLICIYRNRNNVEDYEIIKDAIGEDFNSIIAYRNIREACSEGISNINRWIHKADGCYLEVWLDLQKRANKEVEYLKRFLAEFSMNTEVCFEFENSRRIKYINNGTDEYFNSEINDYLEKINFLLEQIDSKVSACNTIDAYNVQHQSYVTGFASALFALIAIVVSITDEETKSTAWEFCLGNKALLAIFIVLLIYIVIRSLKAIIRNPLVKIQKFIVFYTD